MWYRHSESIELLHQQYTTNELLRLGLFAFQLSVQLGQRREGCRTTSFRCN